MEPIFDRDEFESWLRNGDLSRVVGKVANRFDSPLATFLDQYLGCYVEVFNNRFEQANTGIILGTPEPWARVFINTIDKGKPEAPITAQQALDILATIEP